MDKKTVLVYDSGIGGLTVLLKLQNYCPDYRYLYMSDSKKAPYGKMSKGELFSVSRDNILTAKKLFEFSTVVIACNTLSTNVLQSLEVAFPNINFCGVFPFIEISKFCPTLLLGTKATLNSVYIRKAKRECEFLDTLDLSSLVCDIERNVFHPLDIDVEKYFVGVRKNYRAVVLGCTHFFYVKRKIEKIFPYSRIFWEMLGMDVHKMGKISTFIPKKENNRKLSLENFIFDDKMRNFKIYNFLAKNWSNF